MSIMLGSYIMGEKVLLTEASLATKLAMPGELYELEINTKGIPNPQQVVETLVPEIKRQFDAKTLWIYIDNKKINMQITGSPFAFSALIAYLPTILTGIGVILTFIVIYQIFAGIPSWAWAVLIIGLGTIFLVPELMKTGLEKWGAVRR